MKEIVLYGAGIQGEKFYVKWRKKYKIQYIIDKKCNRLFHGIPVYSFEEKKEDLKRHFIVVAMSKEHYDEVAQKLKDIGRVEFDDFISMDNIDRELMILYGNCHMSIIERYLNANPNITKKYVIWRFYVGNVDADNQIPDDRQLKECSVFVSQDIREENSLSVPGIAQLKCKLSSKCRTIIMPNIYGCNIFFPQAAKALDSVNERHKSELIIKGNEMYSSASQLENLILFLQGLRDINIDRLYKDGKSVDEIVSYILNPESYSHKMIIDSFKRELEKIKEREKFCDITISDYIEENYQKIQLFYDPGHPSNAVLFAYGRKILNYLQIEIDETLLFGECLDSLEMFIYESVKKALNLEFEQKYIRKFNTCCTLQNRAIDLREYVINYIEWNYGEVIDI